MLLKVVRGVDAAKKEPLGRLNVRRPLVMDDFVPDMSAPPQEHHEADLLLLGEISKEWDQPFRPRWIHNLHVREIPVLRHCLP